LKAIIYTAPWCQACKQAAAWLEQQGVEVEEVDYEEAPIDIHSLPTIVIGDEVLTGFNPAQLKRALRSVRK
jgi:arsenate reductase-like glutaredoxin family protein